VRGVRDNFLRDKVLLKLPRLAILQFIASCSPIFAGNHLARVRSSVNQNYGNYSFAIFVGSFSATDSRAEIGLVSIKREAIWRKICYDAQCILKSAASGENELTRLSEETKTRLFLQQQRLLRNDSSRNFPDATVGRNSRLCNTG
jgi:hypothetical protein